MKKIHLSHSFFFGCCAVLLIPAILLWLLYPGVDGVLYAYHHRSSTGDLIFSNATHLGEGYMYGLAAIVFLFINYRQSLIIAVLALASLVSSGLLKWLFGCPRPYTVLQSAQRGSELTPIEGHTLITGYYSFPSGHTIGAFVLFGFIALLTQNKIIQFCCALLASMTAYSRIYLGQHFPRDVVIGAVVGCIVAWLVLQLNNMMNFRMKNEE